MIRQQRSTSVIHPSIHSEENAEWHDIHETDIKIAKKNEVDKVISVMYVKDSLTSLLEELRVL